ncbi:hypothetical protein [Winogradskyella flava]|uniref:hypothetical protein n=1 Tax=Winogradskyella flava TaxID=1884876 RepID=UPI002490B2B6|nr:hypothetical protein [Winogradskyella flava]
MTKTIFILLLIFSFGCRSELKKNVRVTTITDISKNEDQVKFSLDSIKLNINFKPKGDYTSIITMIKVDKLYFDNLYHTNNNKAIDSASAYLYSKLLNETVPHWYGTVWDFNGHTNTPNEGGIACGYFVSTTLKHLGFNLNRYKMAQAAGLDEAKLLQPRSDLKIFSNLSFEQLKSKVNSVYSDGIYFVGLDNHVGYVLLKDKELYFLHSSYCDNKVVIELAENAPCFSSNLYVFAEITSNKNLMRSWILDERLNIPTN